MTRITRLPSRPLRQQDIAALNGDQFRIVPYGGIPGEDGLDVCAVKLATSDTAHALGFDDSQDQWQRLASVETEDPTVADTRLGAVLDDWVQDRYGRRFEHHLHPD